MSLEEERRIYEKQIAPTKIEFKIENDREVAILSDAQGYSVRVQEPHALTRLHYLFSFDISMKNLRQLNPEEKTEYFTNVAKAKPRTLKVIFNKRHQPISVVSSIHQMMKWADIRKEIEAAIKEAYGEVEVEQLGNQIAYKLPVENKYVSAWLNVDPGNNIVRGRSAVNISSRFRTEYDTASGGVHAPCMNWANLWQIPTKLFGVEKERITSVYQLLGVEKAKALNARQIHVTGAGQLDRQRFAEDLKKFTDALNAFRVVVNKAVETPLSRAEMEAILDAYDEKVGVPKYIRKQIMENVKEETVWGFSQAVSMVRTHGDVRVKGDKDPEFGVTVRKLENIAGEVLSLCPAIASIKKQVPQITKEILIPQTQSET